MVSKRTLLLMHELKKTTTYQQVNSASSTFVSDLLRADAKRINGVSVSTVALCCDVRPNDDSAFNHINHRITEICINM